jgi:hypothetical protein
MAMFFLALGPFVSPVSATAYFYNCTGTQHTTHNAVDKDFTDTSYWIKGAAGDAYVRPLSPCSPVGQGTHFGTEYDSPAVLLANIQDFASATSNIVQVGYARCGAVLPCGDVPNDGRPHPVYTKDDDAGGVGYLASWYHNGTLVLNDRYRMKVTRLTSGCGIGGGPVCWDYCIRDISTGESYVCHSEPASWIYPGGNYAWWGSETNNLASQMGVKDSVADFNMDYMQYLSTAASAPWVIRTGITGCVIGGGQPTYYHCNIGTTVYTKDTMTTWTTPH